MPQKIDEHIRECPMCGSTFDERQHEVITCEECSAEGSTACCVGAVSRICYYCEEEHV